MGLNLYNNSLKKLTNQNRVYCRLNVGLFQRTLSKLYVQGSSLHSSYNKKLWHLFSAPRNVEKHFQLKRKPKSAALRADLLQRSHEAATQNRKSNQNTKLARQYSDIKEDDGSTPFMSIASQRRGHLQGRRQSK